MYENLCSNCDQTLTTQWVNCDISRAFGRACHIGLLLKPESLGVRGKLLEWLKCYLSDRVQTVVIKGETSAEKTVPSCVPQGSVLGPLLFVIFINDIVYNIEAVIKLFTGDTSLSLGLTNPNIRAEIHNPDIDTIYEWAKLVVVRPIHNYVLWVSMSVICVFSE